MQVAIDGWEIRHRFFDMLVGGKIHQFLAIHPIQRRSSEVIRISTQAILSFLFKVDVVAINEHGDVCDDGAGHMCHKADVGIVLRSAVLDNR